MEILKEAEAPKIEVDIPSNVHELGQEINQNQSPEPKNANFVSEIEGEKEPKDQLPIKSPTLQKEPFEKPNLKQKLKPIHRGNSINNLKFSFQTSLSKLSSTETLETGIKEINELLEKNKSEQDLSIYLSLIMDEKKNYNLLAKEAIMTVFAQIFITYGTVLASENPEMSRNSMRIREFLIRHFEEINNSFQIAVSQTLVSFYHNCFKEKSIDTKKKFFLEPFLQLFQGKGNPKMHHTASIYFQEILEYFSHLQASEMQKEFGGKIILLFLKLKKNSIFYELLIGIKSLFVEKESTQDLLDLVEEKFINKLLILLANDKNDSKISNINDYMCKVLVCEILVLIPQLIQSLNISQALRAQVIDILKKNSSNRIVKVQKSALLAYKEWVKNELPSPGQQDFLREQKNEEEKFDNSNENKGQEKYQSAVHVKSPSNPPEINNLQEARKNFKIKIGDYRNPRIASVQAKKKWNFVKKKTGLGGGFLSIFPMKKEKGEVRSESKEPKNKLQRNFKEFVLRTKKESKPRDKFDFIDEQKENEKYSKAFGVKLPEPDQVHNETSGNNESAALNCAKESSKNEENLLELQNDAETSQDNPGVRKENNEIPVKTPLFPEREGNQESQSEIKSENLKEENPEAQENQNQIDLAERPLENRIFPSNEDIFQEDENNQGDEAMAPIMPFKYSRDKKTGGVNEGSLPESDQSLSDIKENPSQQKSEDSLMQLRPPTMKKTPHNQEVIANNQNKNSFFNMSVKESMPASENFPYSKYSSGSGQPHRISNFFPNMELTTSQNNFKIDERRKTQNVILEIEEEAIKSSNIKEDEFLEAKDFQADGEGAANNHMLNGQNETNRWKNLTMKNKEALLKMNKKNFSECEEARPNEENQDAVLNEENIENVSNKVFDEEKKSMKKIVTKNMSQIKNMNRVQSSNNEIEIKKTTLEEDAFGNQSENEKNEAQEKNLENRNTLNDQKRSLKKIIAGNINKIKDLKEKQVITQGDEKFDDQPVEFEEQMSEPKNEQEKNKKSIKKIIASNINQIKTMGQRSDYSGMIVETENEAENQKKSMKKIIMSNMNQIKNKNNDIDGKIQLSKVANPPEKEYLENNDYQEGGNPISLIDYQLNEESFFRNQDSQVKDTKFAGTIDFLKDFERKNSGTEMSHESQDLEQSWIRTLDFLKESLIDDAYSEVLNNNDDLLLMRLMSLTGPCINEISVKNMRRLFRLLGEVLASKDLDDIMFDFLEQGLNEKIINDELNIEEQNNILEIVSDFEGRDAAKFKINFEKYL